MILKRIGAVSLGKIVGTLYAVLGLIVGFFLSVAALFGAALAQVDEGLEAWVSIVVGVGAVIWLPVLYGVMGFLAGLLSGAVYNLIAPRVGGLELQLEPATSPPQPSGPAVS